MVRLDRGELGEVMCQLCFGFFPLNELNPVGEGPDGVTRVEDVCIDCAEIEAAMAEDAE